MTAATKASASEQLGLFAEESVTTAPAETPARCRPLFRWWYVTEREAGSERYGGLWYQARCRPCKWDGPERLKVVNLAVEDAMDHAWPGWRDQPVMPEQPRGGQELKVWLAYARRIYPPGWVDDRGPIRTLRGPGLTRHHDGTEWGGYSMAVPKTS